MACETPPKREARLQETRKGSTERLEGGAGKQQAAQGKQHSGGSGTAQATAVRTEARDSDWGSTKRAPTATEELRAGSELQETK